jgi:hypothetical protein
MSDVRKLLAGECYHVGIVVDGVSAAMDEYGALFGVDWGQRMISEVPVELTPGERAPLAFDAIYSSSGPMHVELVQQIPGTIWKVGGGLHHIGFWSDDVDGEAETLAAAGHPVVAALFPDPDGPRMITMHQGPQGMFVELVASAVRPMIEAMWAPPA